EVLAVGDMAFQKKCLGKMNEVSRGGRTVLFVSHNMAAVENLCQRGLVLHQGKLVFDGALTDAIHHYLNSTSNLRDADVHIFDLSKASNRRAPTGKLLKQIELYTDGDLPVMEGVRLGAGLKVKISFDLPRRVDSFDVGLGFANLVGQRIFTAHSLFEP